MPWSKDDNPYKQWHKNLFFSLLTWVRQGLARDWAGLCHLDRWTRTWWESHCLQKRNWRGEHLQDMYINQAYQDMPCTLPESYPKWKQRKDQHRWRTDPWCRSRSPACSAAGSTWTGRWATFENLKPSCFTSCSACPGCRPACLQRRCHIFPCWQWTRQAQTTGTPEQ